MTPAPTLPALVRASGLSLRELGRASGVDVAIISRWLSGEYELKWGAAEKLAKSLGYELRLVKIRTK